MTALLALLSLAPAALAQETTSVTREPAEPEYPLGEAGYYVGGRGGVSVPMGARGLAFPVSLEAGVQFPGNVTLGVRMTFQDDPPEVFGMATPEWAVGPVVDGRYYYRATSHVELYPTGGLGFVFGVNAAGENVVLPVATAGLGVRMQLGDSRAYVSPEVGVTNFIVPYMGLALGYAVGPGER